MAGPIVVVDYGMGNLRSVSQAVEHVAGCAEVVVTDDPARIRGADRVVFPGQGAARDCMASIGEAMIDGAIPASVQVDIRQVAPSPADTERMQVDIALRTHDGMPLGHFRDVVFRRIESAPQTEHDAAENAGLGVREHHLPDDLPGGGPQAVD